MSNPNNENYPTASGPVQRDTVYRFLDKLHKQGEIQENVTVKLQRKFNTTWRGAREMYLDWKYDSENGIYTKEKNDG